VFCDLSLHLFAQLGRSYFIVATVTALCLLGVPTMYWLVMHRHRLAARARHRGHQRRRARRRRLD
jgi:hypothetical protein